MNYTTLNTYLQTLLVDQTPSTDYTTILPAAIQDAENRIYRELDFLFCRVQNATASFAANSRSLTLPTTILVVQGIAAISPAATAPAAGTRNPLEPVSLDFIDVTWPQETGTGATGLPLFYALKDSATAVVAPTPDASYEAEVTGIYRPAPMSNSNQTTYIGDTYPDLLVNACMTFMAAYQRDYGASSDDPKLAMSWEQKYQLAKESVIEEEQRRKGQSTGWSSLSAAPLSTPQRS